MSCINCTSIPEIPSGVQRVHINAAHDYILDRVIELLTRENLSPAIGLAYATVVTDDFSTLINRLGADGGFTSLEKENISILPLHLAQALSFGEIRKAKNLDSWLTLLHAGDLVHVLSNNAMEIHFQPIIDVHKMTIHGYECLGRGLLADGRMMPPGTMFKMAHKTGLLFNLDRQCREAAIRQAVAKQVEGQIFINFLPSAIYNPEFCLRDTVRWIEELHLDPQRIVFEVVETEAVSDIDHLKRILHFYKKSGFGTALDDVGSGYASLNLFALLQPNVLKIDMDLVRDIHITEVKQAIVRALKVLAQSAGTKILAEGIEAEAEFNWLNDLGIDYAQGYYFGKPSATPQRVL